MLSAILSDTLAFRSLRRTERDIVAGKKLQKSVEKTLTPTLSRCLMLVLTSTGRTVRKSSMVITRYLVVAA